MQKKIKKPSIKIFFKTGHVTEKDKELTNQEKYMIIDTKWIYDFLSKHKNNITDVFFTSFFEYSEREFYKKLYTKSGKRKTLTDWIASDLKEGFVQYELIKTIKDNIDNPNSKFITFTKNGKRWDTWWTFLEPPKNKSKFFVKVKKMGKQGEEHYRLRLIEYSTSVNKQKNWEICNKIINSLPNTLIQITSTPRYKAKETELAYLEIIDDELEKCANSFAKFIQEFININANR